MPGTEGQWGLTIAEGWHLGPPAVQGCGAAFGWRSGLRVTMWTRGVSFPPSNPVFPLSRHDPAMSSPTARKADRAVRVELT